MSDNNLKLSWNEITKIREQLKTPTNWPRLSVYLQQLTCQLLESMEENDKLEQQVKALEDIIKDKDHHINAVEERLYGGER